MSIPAGTRIGPYEIVGWLGAGGMGEVYRASDPRLAREVAIKLIPETFASDISRVHRFEQEARAASQLNHPNILAVYDIGVHAGSPYIVSELLEGESLRARLQGGPLPPRRAVDFARQIAEGLAAAHDKHIVHRDVKPENLFITQDGRIKILDFGIAKLMRRAAEDDAPRPPGSATETNEGLVVGTAGYMSPEQLRGETVDARSDIFSVGAILHEMLAGRPAFTRKTPAETMAAILKEDPPPPATTTVSPALSRIISRCLEKSREARYQSARDLAFGLDVLSDSSINAVPLATSSASTWRVAIGLALIAAAVSGAVLMLRQRESSAVLENPLANAQFTRFTDWPGTEGGAEISPDGKFVAFLADREGEFDIWLSQVGTGNFQNLTADFPGLQFVGHTFRKFGFSGDGSEIWFSPDTGPAMAQLIMPLMGGKPRAFLDRGATAPAWSPDGTRLTYFKNQDGDPIFVGDSTGADARQVLVDKGMHSHNPVWSLDGNWIYYARGSEPTDTMDVWRVKPSGESPEALTQGGTAVNFLAPIDQKTLLFVARAEDRSGPWLWALDTERKAARRISSGLGNYTSISASRDGRRIVATVANPTVNLWRVPLLERQAEERDVQPFPLSTARAFAPRFVGAILYYLSTRGLTDGLWRLQDGQTSEVSKSTDGGLIEPPAVSRDGSRIAIIVRKDRQRHLVLVSADGRSSKTLAPSLEIQGAAGQGAADFSPDGKWIVAGARDAQGPGLFKIPVDGGNPVRLVTGQAANPLWSPDGSLIVYAGKFFTGQVELLGIRPDGATAELPALRARPGGYRFLPDGTGLVYLPFIPSLDFWNLDFATKTARQLTHLGNHGALGTFDIMPDGKSIVFDRLQENSDIVLIELPR